MVTEIDATEDVAVPSLALNASVQDPGAPAVPEIAISGTAGAPGSCTLAFKASDGTATSSVASISVTINSASGPWGTGATVLAMAGAELGAYSYRETGGWNDIV